ncbi:MAG TPA: lipoate--protein ligase family protein [Candidatus Cloacimonetes bacterium]|nr:lipoate--protein ligase family protein [Candidatus Cloacimonadota bacterium]HEX38139.1 lipoate--protein ligase family protein [Candidatus Cloacimonadota bacterium]
MEKTWRFINSGKMKPHENMALDEALLFGIINRKLSPVVRVYDWDPPTVSFGYHQKIEEHILPEKIKEFGFGIVRRPTGGRAVLHYDEVTYAVIAPIEGILSGSILDSYKRIGEVLLASLEDVGIEATMKNSMPSEQEQKNWTNPCFSSASKYEINYRGSKIIGSAQIRKGNALLQHGSILLNHNQELMAELMPTRSEKERSIIRKLLAKKTIPINQLSAKPISFNYFTRILKKNFKINFSISFSENIKLTPYEEELFERFKNKYKI